jgi:hypothetical protein
MKNKTLKVLLLTLISILIIWLGYSQFKKINTNISISDVEKVEIAQEIFPIAPVINRKANYSNGVITNVRVLEYYNDLIRTGIPMKDAKFGLTTIITEWNKYDANVASPQGGFIEKEMFPSEETKRQMIAGGIDLKVDGNSTMVGGDEETNRRFVEPSKRYWAVASKVFEQEFSSMKKAEGISDRTEDYVTFDFITTSGFYTVQVRKSDLESGKSVWSKVFEESKFLNTEMARVQNEANADFEKVNNPRLTPWGITFNQTA